MSAAVREYAYRLSEGERGATLRPVAESMETATPWKCAKRMMSLRIDTEVWLCDFHVNRESGECLIANLGPRPIARRLQPPVDAVLLDEGKHLLWFAPDFVQYLIHWHSPARPPRQIPLLITHDPIITLIDARRRRLAAARNAA